MQVIFIPSSFFVSLLFEGIIWFLLPTGLVIINDIAAYLAGGHCVLRTMQFGCDGGVAEECLQLWDWLGKAAAEVGEVEDLGL